MAVPEGRQRPRLNKSSATSPPTALAAYFRSASLPALLNSRCAGNIQPGRDIPAFPAFLAFLSSSINNLQNLPASPIALTSSLYFLRSFPIRVILGSSSDVEDAPIFSASTTHGPELINAKGLPVKPHPLAAIKHRSPVLSPDPPGNPQQQWAQEQQARCSANNIKSSFKKYTHAKTQRHPFFCPQRSAPCALHFGYLPIYGHAPGGPRLGPRPLPHL